MAQSHSSLLEGSALGLILATTIWVWRAAIRCGESSNKRPGGRRRARCGPISAAPLRYANLKPSRVAGGRFMMKVGPLLCALLLAGVAPPRLAAQSLADVCRAVITTRVGQWASFDATGGRSGGGKLRLAIVGSERAGDSTLYWFEMSFAGNDPSRSAILQLLTSGLGRSDARARAVIVKYGGQPAMKVSGAMADMLSTGLGRNNPAADWTARCTATHVVGWESVTVPAGTFRALPAPAESGP